MRGQSAKLLAQGGAGRRRIQSSRPNFGGGSRATSGISGQSARERSARLMSGRSGRAGHAGESPSAGGGHAASGFDEEYYTMSSSGVTHYYRGSVSYTSSFEFVKEFKSFSQVRGGRPRAMCPSDPARRPRVRWHERAPVFPSRDDWMNE